jgi:hypothetical protein
MDRRQPTRLKRGGVNGLLADGGEVAERAIQLRQHLRNARRRRVSASAAAGA